MADNVYLIETRLSPGQQSALEAIRSVARQQGLTVFLVGGAVRDLMSGSPVRDLDVAVQGNALQLRAELERVGASYSGESTALQALYVNFPAGVRVEVGSTLSATYPKPGKPIYQATTILEDLRRRDFTANAMALSLNEGSYGLLMDPLNGVADIENRELRLVSNYGFLEDPVRLIRAARFMSRLGWQMDDRTRSRYETAKEEDYISALQSSDRGYEVEELFHEEEPLRVMRRLEEEGWLKHLSPALNVAKVNAPELARLREAQMQLETRGVRTDAAAANFPLLTGKISAAEISALKKSFPRTAFVTEIDHLEASAKELAAQLQSKAMILPSEAYKLISRSDPVVVLWTMHSSKSPALQARFKSFLSEWPLAQQKLPILLMTEMRITPELPGYAELQQDLFYAIMDGRLSTSEEMKAFLEPYSPPAPPPPISLKRPRAPRKEAKTAKSKKKAPVESPSQGVPNAAEAPEQALPKAAEQTVVIERPAEKKLKTAVLPSRRKSTAKPELNKKESDSRAALSKRVAEPTTTVREAAKKSRKTAPSLGKVKTTIAKSNPKRTVHKSATNVPSKATKQKSKAAVVQSKRSAPAKASKKAARKVTSAKTSSPKHVVKKKSAPAKTAKKASTRRR